jgi:hypothetical protein
MENTACRKDQQVRILSYTTREALFLSEKEELIIAGLVQDIIQEVGINAELNKDEYTAIKPLSVN